ncbi:uncharacterized protein V1516DRAFT_171658 [Lipomyces oligophaga]|uniref:uncharacterized protein n=1 Tax=Lipomyces oligophaga TaxID=45792 RepID=UPI0034CE3DF7
MGLLDPLLSLLGAYSASNVYNFLRGYSDRSYLDPEIDIALVTGGSNGHGATLVKKLNELKIPVVVLDLVVPDQQVEGVYYLKCDISSREQLLEAAQIIKSQIGNITILVNNVTVSQGKTVLDLSFDEIESSFNVNLLSQFYTVKIFLPGMLKLKRGYIVFISSVVAYLGPAKLSEYMTPCCKQIFIADFQGTTAASKSAILGLYDSLTYELGPNADTDSGVRTLLVIPGQMSSLLQELQNPSTRLTSSILDVSMVADRIMLALSRGEEGKVTVPRKAKFISLMRTLPRPATTMIRSMVGVDNCMDHYVGTKEEVDDLSFAL